MDELENKLGTILQNPEMMEKIMAFAQSLGQTQQQSPPQQNRDSAIPGDIDLSMLQKLSGFAKQSSIDKNQQSLLRALAPYLSHQRISKLEKAMRAAKMASMAGLFLGR